MPVTQERGFGGRDLTAFPSVPESALLVRRGRCLFYDSEKTISHIWLYTILKK